MHINFNQMSRHWPGFWVPTLYFTEGLPNIIVTTVALIMFKRLGFDNADTALYTSWFSLPWMLKPFWSPVVELVGRKRTWILTLQLLIGVALACVGFTLPMSNNLQWLMIFFFLIAFSSATHDIAADGFYMIELTEQQQSLFVGIRSTFFRLSMITGQGVLVMLAGALEAYLKVPSKAWAWTFFISAILFFLLVAVHAYIIPKSSNDCPSPMEKSPWNDYLQTFLDFFKKPHIGLALTFMLLYRMPEAMLVKICPLFFLDPNDVANGGLGLTTADIGFAQGTIGVIGLILGGILGGVLVSLHGFRRWLWPMVLSISLPNAVYILMAYYQPTGMLFIGSCIFVEQLGYGFGFTAYMLYMLYFSQGKNQTAHYAFCTGFMTLGLILPGMVAGYLQEALGYLNFFIFVMCLCPVTFIVSALIKFDPLFGKSATKKRKE